MWQKCYHVVSKHMTLLWTSGTIVWHSRIKSSLLVSTTQSHPVWWVYGIRLYSLVLHHCFNVLTSYPGDLSCFYFESSVLANHLSQRFPVFRFLSADWPAAVVGWTRLHLLDSGGGPHPAMEGCSHGVFKTTWNPCQATRSVPYACSCKWKYVHFGKERKNSFTLCHRSLALRFSHRFTPPPPFGKYLWISKKTQQLNSCT